MSQAPMSAPASPTRVNRKAVFARGVPQPQVAGHGEDRAGAGAHPSTAATTGCGQCAHRLDQVAGHRA
jgi:hypothetical protein